LATPDLNLKKQVKQAVTFRVRRGCVREEDRNVDARVKPAQGVLGQFLTWESTKHRLQSLHVLGNASSGVLKSTGRAG
jgi:hypothetical protein